MAIVALKPISIGPYTLDYGDPLTPEAQRELPPGRLAQLQTHGFLTEVVDEVADTRQVEKLARRVEVLEAEVANLRTVFEARLRPAKPSPTKEA